MLDPVAKERVIAAMSGGVDSSVAAARLVDAGYDVVGVTLHLWDYPEGSEPGRCCAPEDQYDARAAADAIGIPHYTFDRRELFARDVVAPFVDAYLEGATPSPCVHCNRSVKMYELFGIADRLGARFIASGHYAKTAVHEGRTALFRGRDTHKDQSYFLHTLVASPSLDRLVLPLGDATKEEVRRDAVDRDLPGANKGESQELCFVPKGGYDAFVAARAGGRIRPGPIVDDRGAVVGHHEGIHGFTVGQRKGLGVALGAPMFVAALEPATSTVRLARAGELAFTEATLEEGTFAPDVAFPRDVTLQVRARHRGVKATLVKDDRSKRIRARFKEPVGAVSRGQFAVAYDGDRVLGGATILEAVPTRTQDPCEQTL